ncbi:hypothetical protein PRNP1_001516 [Phytophthora ramorum]
MAANEIFNDLNIVLQLNQHIQGVSVSGNGARILSPPPAGSLAKQTSFKVLTNLDSVSYSEPREDAQFDHQRSIFLSVSSCDLPFHLQGDKDFNEASAMAKRRALRFSELVKSRIEFLWEVAGGKKQAEVAQRIRQKQLEENDQGRGRRGEQSVRRAGAANEIKQLLPPLEELDEEDYMALMLLIFKVLRDDFVLELAQKQIQCDWEVDSHHGKTLSFDQFFAAVFELVDVWTCDMEEVTYERFVHLLARRITRRVAVFLDGAELKLSLSDNFEPEVVVKSIPLRTIPRFVSVARVVAATGMSTIGELARADPQVVERERVDFLQRNNGGAVPDALSEIRKIGQDLETLLAMFKSIALQFENINYTLDNNILRRTLSPTGPRRPGKHTSEMATGNEGLAGQGQRHSANIAVNADTPSSEATNGEVRSVASGVGEPSARESGTHSCFGKYEAGTRPAQATAVGVTSSSMPGDYVRVAADTTGSRLSPPARDSNLDVAPNPDAARSSKRNGSMIEGKQTKNQARSGSESSPSHFQPLNNFHDLQAADANVVNALRSTFLIEKAISIERQTELPAIRDELTKFGVDVDPAKLPEETVKDRYNALYDMLVLRDGESLKTLASVMLEQIKLELSVHGIIVDDEEDVEEVYDGFFASVVTGTGESIVQDAQRWMEGTVQGNKVNDYIQHDFHELESIDDVKPLGTRRGDEEFQSLLAKGTDDIADDAAESTNRPQGRKNSSPIQRKPSRVLAVPLPVVVTSQENQSRPPGPVEKSLPHSSQPEQVVAAVKENAAHGSNENQKMAKKKKPGYDKSSDPPPPSDQAPASADGARRQSGKIQQEKLPATSRKPKLTISTLDSMQCSASEDTESASSGPPVEAADNSAPDDPKHKRPAGISHHGRPGTGFEVDGAIDGKKYHDASEQHTTRDALNIAIEFEEDDSAPGALSSRVDGERSVSMEPKVPQIVIGGASSARNVPVTGRYIQLLGVGTVLITKGEREFFQLLRSHEGLKTDLVCFDIGTELDTALTKLQTIQERVGNRVILFGGNTDEPGKTQQVALECLAHGALHFANIPFDFPRLREKIISFFEDSKQPYILRQRKPPGQAAHVGSTIGAGSLFALHDEPRKVSTSVAFAKTPRRKLAVAIPALPSLPHPPRDSTQSLPQGLSESRRADFTPIAPSTPRSSQSRNKSPRFSAALNKLIR